MAISEPIITPEVIYNDVETTIQSVVITRINVEGLTKEEIRNYQRTGILQSTTK